ncbi:MAG: hypothetical protein ACFB11_17980 [Paracoccaceae bacterium]
MRIWIATLLISATVLSACATVRDSRINPANWFGSSRPAPAPVIDQSTDAANPLIPQRRRGFLSARREREAIYQGQPVQAIRDLAIDRVPGGAIIRATGVAARDGVHSVQLTPENEDLVPIDGVLLFRLEGITPEVTGLSPNPRTRTVVAAYTLTDQELAGVDTIRVEAATNARSSRRR